MVIDPQFIHFKLVTTQVEMMHVGAVRGICTLEEVGVSAQHEFDDNENDNFATHALGYYYDEPISGVRRAKENRQRAVFEGFGRVSVGLPALNAAMCLPDRRRLTSIR